MITADRNDLLKIQAQITDIRLALVFIGNDENSTGNIRKILTRAIEEIDQIIDN